MKRSEKLAKMFPMSFSEDMNIEKELFKRCETIFSEIERRYNVECNAMVTREMINKISKTLNQIIEYRKLKDE